MLSSESSMPEAYTAFKDRRTPLAECPPRKPSRWQAFFKSERGGLYPQWVESGHYAKTDRRWRKVNSHLYLSPEVGHDVWRVADLRLVFR